MRTSSHILCFKVGNTSSPYTFPKKICQASLNLEELITRHTKNMRYKTHSVSDCQSQDLKYLF